MKKLLLLVALLFSAPAFAAPFLISDPAPANSGATHCVYQEGTAVAVVTPLVASACKADLAGVLVGVHNLQVWFRSDVWGPTAPKSLSHSPDPLLAVLDRQALVWRSDLRMRTFLIPIVPAPARKMWTPKYVWGTGLTVRSRAWRLGEMLCDVEGDEKEIEKLAAQPDVKEVFADRIDSLKAEIVLDKARMTLEDIALFIAKHEVARGA